MSDLYNKLVDMYAGRELPVELEDQMEVAAYHDGALKREMTSLRNTVDLLKSDTEATFTDDSYQRILGRIYSKVDSRPVGSDDNKLQYRLPISI